MPATHYQIAHLGVGPFRQGQIVPAERLEAKDAQIERLLRIGAITESDGPTSAAQIKSVRSAFGNSAGIVDQAGLDRPDIASRTDVLVLSPDEREEVVEEFETSQEAAEAENTEEVVDAETVEGETPVEVTPSASKRRRKN